MPLTKRGSREENDDSIVFVMVEREGGKGEEVVPVGRRKAASLPLMMLEGEASAE